MKTNNAQIELTGENTYPADVTQPEGEVNNPPRRKIVYVDDNYFSLIALKERLKSVYEIFPRKSAEGLFETLEKVGPDIILLDINMPGTDGFDIIKGLKASADFSNIPVIFLTADKDKTSIAAGIDLGAADFIFKPFEDQDIIDRIELQLNEEKQKKARPIILAVDDNPSLLKSINQLLHDTYTVYTLPKPEAITETLKMVKPDLFLLDYHMPKMSGTELSRTIRKMPEFEKTPIVFLTSDATSDSLYTAVGTGADDYVIKPIDEKKLKTKLETHLKGYMKRRIIRSLI